MHLFPQFSVRLDSVVVIRRVMRSMYNGYNGAAADIVGPNQVSMHLEDDGNLVFLYTCSSTPAQATQVQIP